MQDRLTGPSHFLPPRGPWLGKAAERALFVGTPYSDAFGSDSGAVYQYDVGIAGAFFTQAEFAVEVRTRVSLLIGYSDKVASIEPQSREDIVGNVARLPQAEVKRGCTDNGRRCW